MLWRRRLRRLGGLETALAGLLDTGEARQSGLLLLKVEGIHDCAEVLVAALMDDRERHI